MSGERKAPAPLPPTSAKLKNGRVEVWIGKTGEPLADGGRRYEQTAPTARFASYADARLWADLEHPDAEIVSLTVFTAWDGWRPRAGGSRRSGVWEEARR